jgi:uncharacterized protein YdhG (YjbR/CyaY superfamily)
MSTNKRKAALARQAWFREFESIVTEALPEISGKISWDTPTFMQDALHLSPAEAAIRFLGRPEFTVPRPVNPQVKESDQ